MSTPTFQFPNGSILDPNLQVTFNLRGNDYQLWEVSRTETYSYEGRQQQAVWTFYCLWEQRYEIAQALIGGSQLISNATAYTAGLAYPDNQSLVAMKSVAEPDGLQAQQVIDQQVTGGASAMIDFQRAKMTITFGVPDYIVGTPNVGEEELDFGVDSYQLPTLSPSLQWADGTALEQGQVRTVDIPVIGYSKSIFNAAALPMAAIRACINKANSTTFLGAAEGMVIFKGGRSRRKITPSGYLNWDVTYSFAERSIPWTQFYRSSTKQFEDAQYLDGTPVVLTADLNQLFIF